MSDRVDEFVALLRKARGVTATIDRPDNPMGECFIDVTGPGFETQISYRPSIGFGFFLTGSVFGQRPDLLFQDPAAAADQVLKSVTRREDALATTAPPR